MIDVYVFKLFITKKIKYRATSELKRGSSLNIDQQNSKAVAIKKGGL